MPTFRFEGHDLAYSEYGSGPRTVVLLHALLYSQEMHAPLARRLANAGNHVVTLDLLGHGVSDRPTEMWDYSMVGYGRQVVGLLDHLGVDQAVVFGTSLGANSALEAAAAAPERIRALVIEMPVLDNALLGSAMAFTPALVALTFGAPVMRALAGVLQRVRRVPMPFLLHLGLGVFAQDPKPSASLLQGIFFGRTAPPRDVRRTLTAPALVIGHHHDPIHPFSDAGMLAEEMPNATLLTASSILELRAAPDRLTDEIAAFIDAAWRPKKAPARRRVAATA